METLDIGGVAYSLVRLEEYDRTLARNLKLEPRLHEEVLKALKIEAEAERLDRVPGTGGWFKLRVPSPSRNIGKSGGFRAIGIGFWAHESVYLYSVYDHRRKADLEPWEKAYLSAMAGKLGRSFHEKDQKALGTYKAQKRNPKAKRSKNQPPRGH